MKKYFIHASNIQGTGALQVCKYIIENLINDKNLYKIYVSNDLNNNLDINYPLSKKIIVNNKFIPNIVKRILDLFFGFLFYPKIDCLLLGDLPINLNVKQNILLHNPHVVDSNFINIKNLKYIFNKLIYFLIFFLNGRKVNKYYVQTNHMREQLIRKLRFHNLNYENNIIIFRTPLSNEFNSSKFEIIKARKKLKWDKKFTFFYPASFYEHKNHKFFQNFNLLNSLNKIDKIYLTINKNKIKLSNNKIQMIGKLNLHQVIDYYKKTHILLFPSLNESLGLPLIEAQSIGMPIFVYDAPYSREICKNAIFFNSFDDFISKLNSYKFTSNNLLNDSFSWKDLSFQLKNFS